MEAPVTEAPVTEAPVNVGESTMESDRNAATACRTDPAKPDFALPKARGTPLPFNSFIFICLLAVWTLRRCTLRTSSRSPQPNTRARPSCEPKENLMLKLYNSEFQMTISGRRGRIARTSVGAACGFLISRGDARI